MVSNRWLLPEGIQEVLPPQAERLEQLRRRILDTYKAWGYDLVIPPLIEYLDSLLVGTGSDVDLKTFKVTDQLNGRTMGIRADMTPQVARIDAHSIKNEQVSRLCYLGVVLHTRSDGFAGTRSPLQLGAEIYGYAGIESDVESLSLMLETLDVVGVPDVHIDLGHVGVFRNLARHAGLNDEQEQVLFDALQRKAITEINEFVLELDITTEQALMFRALCTLNGGVEVLEKASEVLTAAGTDVIAALDELKAVAAAMSLRKPDVPMHFDLAELRGYHFHTGLVFAAFVPGKGTEIARGGRYDDLGSVFGRNRPATGFSTDLKTLTQLCISNKEPETETGAILAEWDDDPLLQEKMKQLRADGERVIQLLPGQSVKQAEHINRQLVKQDNQWKIINL